MCQIKRGIGQLSAAPIAGGQSSTELARRLTSFRGRATVINDEDEDLQSNQRGEISGVAKAPRQGAWPPFHHRRLCFFMYGIRNAGEAPPM